jgi:hypothetical protein
VWFSRAPTAKTTHGPSPAPTTARLDARFEAVAAIEPARLAHVEDEPRFAGHDGAIVKRPR